MAVATIIELLGQPKGEAVTFNCGDSAGIEKGTVLWLAGNKTVSGASTTNAPFAGIASAEKVKDDGSTTIACWTRGQFGITMDTDTPCSTGELLRISGQNTLSNLNADNISGGIVVGRALSGTLAASVCPVLIG